MEKNDFFKGDFFLFIIGDGKKKVIRFFFGFISRVFSFLCGTSVPVFLRPHMWPSRWTGRKRVIVHFLISSPQGHSLLFFQSFVFFSSNGPVFLFLKVPFLIQSSVMIINKCKVRVTTGSSAIHQSINQSIKQKVPSRSINQSIYNLLLISIDSTNQAIKQSIDLSVPWHLKSTNQSINRLSFHNLFSLWIVEVSRFSEFSARFWMIRKVMGLWDGAGDAGERGEPSPGTGHWCDVKMIKTSILFFRSFTVAWKKGQLTAKRIYF